jgi:group II intron reverse transcriptase/maturase
MTITNDNFSEKNPITSPEEIGLSPKESINTNPGSQPDSINQQYQVKTSKNPVEDWEKIEHWDNIKKVKWIGLPMNENITKTFKEPFRMMKSLNVLKKINNKNKEFYYYKNKNLNDNQKPKKISNIYNLIYDIDILMIAYSQVVKNKGSMTPGSAGTTADNASMSFLTKISNELKNETFKWSPTKRVYIPKPGKKVMRPLGLPDFKDKIVQAAIRLILEPIFEPYFDYLNTNYGYRPKKGATPAIEAIKNNTQGSRYALEADIKGAYDNVSHNKLILTLQEFINDKKLIKLIYDGLKAGILEKDTYFDTFMGTTQGSILSPLLFNIYMSSFDEFIKFKIPQIIQEHLGEQYNLTKSKTIKEKTNPEYEKFGSTKKRSKKKIQSLQDKKFEDLRHTDLISTFQTSNYCKIILDNTEDLKNLHERILNTSERRKKSALAKQFHEILNNTLKDTEKEKIRTILLNKHTKILEEATSILRNTKYTPDDVIRNIRLFYIRYADDWVLFSRSDKDLLPMIQEQCANYLKTELNLELSQEKTKITDIHKQKVNFLGFEIFYQRNPLRKFTIKGSTQRFQGNVNIYPDVARMENRFKLKGYLDKHNKPREVPFLSVLTDQEIIKKFNQFMMGIGTFYIPTISRTSTLYRWIYILYYSCIKTLAQKHKKSVKSIILEYGLYDTSNKNLNMIKPRAYDLRITAEYTYDGEKRYETLLNAQELMYHLLRIRYKYTTNLNNNIYTPLPNTIDFLTLNKVGLRTAFKLTSKCCICGAPATDSHHIKKLNHSGGRYEGYRGIDKVVASLGRKQIPVCLPCHDCIHAGKYNKLSLNDLYDIRLIAPEGILQNINSYKTVETKQTKTVKKTTENVNITLEKIMLGPKSKPEISMEQKTYFNKSFHDFLNHKHLLHTEDNNQSSKTQPLSTIKRLGIIKTY